jgi:DEAD/DEAH box helicase domain-containing protein
MVPSVLTNQIRKGIEDFLQTTFPVSSPFFHGILDCLVESDDLFKGPYLSIKLPFRPGNIGPDFFQDIPLDFTPYLHQEKAFRRLSGERARSTLVATGTGSGKTECFLYPILDYGYQHRGERGIKAILIYPMNALATDQARRIARVIYNNPSLKDKITAGLFIGQSDEEASMVMAPDRVITHRTTLRLSPPDILLTNYKMLDYLLIRPWDLPLWKDNGPETLKYLVVDELHTFDGAQGTDLACLIRRLKERLKTPDGYLCCVGTSATLGGESNFDELRSYAGEVFGEAFDEEAVVTESALTPGEFFGDSFITQSAVVPPEQADRLKPDRYPDDASYIQSQHGLWLGKAIEDFDREDWKITLGEKLKQLAFFRNLLLVLNNKTVSILEVIQVLDRIVPEFSQGSLEYKQDLINSLVALVSCARIRRGNPVGRPDFLPFLHVRFQLWLRELRRVVGEVSEKPRLRFSDDLKGEQLRNHLPLIHCRECGAMGWGGTKRDQDTFINPDLQHFYVCFFNYNPTVTFIFPRDSRISFQMEPEFVPYLCGYCLHLSFGHQMPACPSCGKTDRVIPVFIPPTRIKQKDTVRGTHNCPFCEGFNSLTILGSRAASLTSIAISQLYASTFNDDKKLLAFSDSVQDASHRAGFFAARTYRFNFRSALQQFVDRQTEELTLSQMPEAFIEYWSGTLPEKAFIATFLPPDMAWMQDYEALIKNKKLPEDSSLRQDLHKRIDWEITSEYGFNCRIGRTLEKTGSSIAYPDAQRVQKAVDQLIEPLRNEIGGLRNLDPVTLHCFLCGLLTQMKTRGAISHPSLEAYIDDWGGYYRLNRIPYMPGFGKHSRTPAFLTTKRGTRFDTLLRGGTSRTWYEEWAVKSLRSFDPLISGYLEILYKLALPVLVSCEILKEFRIQGFLVWGLHRSALWVSREVRQYRCNACGHNLSAAQAEAEYWNGNPCLRFRCGGRYEEEAPKEDYYGKLYSTGDVKRIFAEEHTGLLDREVRESLEKRFIQGEDPWDPNLLSCTPTLEMGIDIGDLSSVILCSVPPSQANYLQRIGRSGRRDGNSLTVTLANARPHDLYFYDQPEEMIAGKVNPPGCFLNASAVLERQLTAFCFDRWIETGIPIHALPDHLGQVLNHLDRKEKKDLFPYNFLDFIENNRTVLFEWFIAMFRGSLTPESIENLRVFVEGNGGGQENLRYRIIHGLTGIYKERQNLRKKVQRLTDLIKKKENSPVKDQNYESELDELRREKSIINSVIHTINAKDTFNFFTDEGLLPNYAFPEAGVILRSIIYRVKKKVDSQGRYETKLFEYERPAASAIHELAPANRFYAEGRRVVVDQIDMGLSEIEEWRFCSNCSHHERIATSEEKSCCPKCGSLLWADEGQKQPMLRMRQVVATTSDRESRSQDDSDDREPEFYNQHMLVDIDEKHIEEAYRIDREDLPFGFEFLSKATFREVNFGKKEVTGETTSIAGYKIPKNGFSVCRECGKVQEVKEEVAHAIICKYRNSTSEKNILSFLYLYREFSSEAIRILLPITSLADTNGIGAQSHTPLLHSFIAALFLGLKKKFKGNIDHLQTTLYEEPIANSSYRKKYLILYDIVPGGTGYLKELLRAEKPFLEVFEKALEVLKSCSCRQDPEKDGCYRCLFAYRNSYDMKDTSRETAMRLLSHIVDRKDALVKTDSLKKISLNALFDSELEARFIEALRRSKFENQPVSLKQDIVNGKPGWYLKINNLAYYIEPQVELGPGEGISLPSKADFVFYPERQRGNRVKPVAVFTDGFMYHADISASKSRIGKDMAQRMAIVRSGKYSIWSLTWEDVENKFNPQPFYFINFTHHNPQVLFKLLDAYEEPFKVKTLSGMSTAGSFDMLIQYLSQPDVTLWKMYALIQSLIPINPQNLCSKSMIETLSNLLQGNLPWKEVVLEMKPEKSGDYLSGFYEKYYDNQSPMIKLLAYAEKQSLQNRKIDELRVVCRLFDDDELAVNSVFKSVWNGFLRMFNIYQFAPGALFITSQGVAQGEYVGLEEKPEKDTFGEKEVEATAAFIELKKITDPSLHPLLSFLAARHLPLPEAGYELCNEKGEIIAVAELGWPEQKVAFLLEEEMEYKQIFVSVGWRIAPLREVMVNLEQYISLIS